VDPDQGNVLGSFPTGIFSNGAVSSPVIGPSGAVYLASDKLYAIGDGIPSPSPTPEADWAGYAGAGPEDNMESLVGPHLLDTLQWTVSAGSPLPGAPSLLHSTPAIDVQGNLYFGSFDGLLRAVSPQGVTLWTYNAGAPILTSPALHNDTVFFYSDDGKLTALSLAGDLVWSVVLVAGGDTASSPVVDHGKVHVVLGSSGKLFAISPADGSELWSFGSPASGHFLPFSPAFDEAGNAYICDTSGNLYAFTSLGTNLAHIFSGALAPAPITTGLTYFSGHLYAGTASGAVVKATPESGTVATNTQCSRLGPGSQYKWQLAFDVHTGLLYGSCAGEVFAFYSESFGTLWMQFGVGASAVLVGGDGTVYAVATNGDLYALDSNGNIMGTYSTGVPTGGAVSSPVIGPSGAIYLASNKLYAITD